MAARVDAETTVLRCGVVQVHEHSHHSVLLEREVRIVLVHEVRSAFLRWFDVRLRVVKEYIWTGHEILDGIEEFGMHDQTREDGAMHLQVVDGLYLYERAMDFTEFVTRCNLRIVEYTHGVVYVVGCFLHVISLPCCLKSVHVCLLLAVEEIIVFIGYFVHLLFGKNS